ncbi:putative capsular polysaccharide synthesis family protein [Thalassobacillus devorans]|uniref:putative capsular polysaccharide synthesis family protein n=1 Tax=Thalassobacillus devorans TaxID=279813 RepID=UPI00048FDFAB|nr:putative capsular polysaccharide synthesis family protein [Thalassobacillus devorans]
MSKLKKIANFNQLPIVIYTMGKVGSRSIVKELNQNGIEPLDLHWLNYTYHTKKDLKFLHKKKFKLKAYEVVHNILVKLIFKLQKKQIKVLTIIRDPITVRHSFLFQDLHLFLYDYFEMNKGTARENSDGDFMKKIMDTYIKENYFVEHLQNELFETLEIKEENLNFNKQRGYGFYNNKKFNILMVTLEKLNDNHQLVGDFLGIPFHAEKSNDSMHKWYNPLKSKFSEEISYDEGYLRRFYQENRVDLFYTEEDIETFIAKWKTKETSTIRQKITHQ